jgi:hypothetical protein
MFVIRRQKEEENEDDAYKKKRLIELIVFDAILSSVLSYIYFSSYNKKVY